MSRLFLQILLCSAFIISGMNVFAKTFREALDECAGQNTEQCNKIRRVYHKRKQEMAAKKRALKQESASAKTELKVNSPEQKSLAVSQREEKKEEKRDEPVSPFALGYYSEFVDIGSSKDTGESKTNYYAHLHGKYKTKWGWAAFLRIRMIGQFDTSNDQDPATMLDPRFGLEGVLWSGEKWSFWSRLYFELPVSQSSSDNGVTAGFGTNHALSFAFSKTVSFDLGFGLRGQFFGFGTEDGEDRANGSMYVEPSLTFVLGEKSSLTLLYSSGFSRKVGRDLGYLVFNDGAETAFLKFGYKFASALTVTPGIGYGLESTDTSFRIEFSGSFF